ncbi:MAG: GAF domain-containing protein, partial [Anaerolineae bacterium]|nr:GAF domain-containing protein [Anaerolineae bacterium]
RAAVYEADRPFTAVLEVPLKWQNRTIGVLAIDADAQQRTFNQNDLWLATLFANQAAVAIENARIYEEKRKRVSQLRLIGGVIQKIASILNLDELLYPVAHLIGDTFRYYYTSILLVETNTNELLLKAVAGPYIETLVDRLRLKIGQEGIVGWVAHSGEPLLVNDVRCEPKYYFAEQAKDTRSELAVPIKLKGEIIGVLDVQSVELDAFSEDDVFILQTLADQLAVAIENARLYQETVRRLEEAETLGAVTTALTRSLDLDQVLQSIVDSATRLIPVSTSGVIHLADEATGKLIPRATSLEAKIQENMGMPIGKGIAGLVMQEKRLINVPNVEQDPRFIQLDTGTPKKSLLTAPLLIDRDCIGTLSLNSDQVGAFSADDERLLTTLAAQAAIAVRNARLYQEVHRRVEELIFLNRVGRTVTSSLDLEQILTTVLEETARVLRTEAGSILLLDEESSELVFEAAVGPRLPEEMKGLRSPLGQGIAGWVAREGQRLLVPDVKEDPRFYPGIDEATGFVTKSVLAVPLKVKGKVIGVIEAVNKTEGNFTQANVALLSSMAQWAAIAIENAQLFAETRQRFEEMAALHDTSLDITARLEMPELLKSIVERAVGLLRADTGEVYLYDQEQEALRLAIGYDYTEKYVGATLKPGEGMAGRVFQTGEPLIVDDYHAWEGRAAIFESDQPFIAALQVPLKWQERIIGVLAIDADVQERTFNQDDVWLATLFANQAVIAIENARLYEELQNRIEELKRTQAQ